MALVQSFSEKKSTESAQKRREHQIFVPFSCWNQQLLNMRFKHLQEPQTFTTYQVMIVAAIIGCNLFWSGKYGQFTRTCCFFYLRSTIFSPEFLVLPIAKINTLGWTTTHLIRYKLSQELQWLVVKVEVDTIYISTDSSLQDCPHGWVELVVLQWTGKSNRVEDWDLGAGYQLWG